MEEKNKKNIPFICELFKKFLTIIFFIPRFFLNCLIAVCSICKLDERSHIYFIGIIWGGVIISTLFFTLEIVPTYILFSYTGADFDSSAVLTFWGAILSAVATASLGALSLLQNQRFKEENDNAQKTLMKLQRKQELREWLELSEKLKSEVDSLFYAKELSTKSNKPLTSMDISMFYTLKFKEIDRLTNKIIVCNPEFIVSQYMNQIKTLRTKFTQFEVSPTGETAYYTLYQKWKDYQLETVQIGHEYIWDILEEGFK